jgi:1-acyl-sn-glycerol-3-phosphate acyltransferase
LAIIKLLRLAGHLLTGTLIVLLWFPRLDAGERGRYVSRWAERMLHILKIRVVVRGQLPERSSGALVVANHTSWLDIHVLHSLLPVRFISKADVRGWPLIGWLAQEVGTVFLVRERKTDAKRVNELMAAQLQAGDLLALFPEGTTSDGREVLPFFPSLFQPAIDAQAPVWPARLRYLDADGNPSEAAAYYGGISLGESMWRIAGCSEIVVEVSFLPLTPFQEGRDRRELARACEAAIRAAGDGQGMPPETGARLPA